MKQNQKQVFRKILKCQECGNIIISKKRSDTLFCSNKCMSKSWTRRNPIKISKYNFKKDIKLRYGLKEEDYNKLVFKQKNKCCICKRHKKLCIDHDHLTGKIRGLLCHRCNTILSGLELATSKHWKYLGGEL
jgi:hypothetical protein